MLTRIEETGKYKVNDIYFFEGCKYYVNEVETCGNLSRLWLKPVQG